MSMAAASFLAPHPYPTDCSPSDATPRQESFTGGGVASRTPSCRPLMANSMRDVTRECMLLSPSALVAKRIDLTVLGRLLSMSAAGLRGALLMYLPEHPSAGSSSRSIADSDRETGLQFASVADGDMAVAPWRELVDQAVGVLTSGLSTLATPSASPSSSFHAGDVAVSFLELLIGVATTVFKMFVGSFAVEAIRSDRVQPAIVRCFDAFRAFTNGDASVATVISDASKRLSSLNAALPPVPTTVESLLGLWVETSSVSGFGSSTSSAVASALRFLHRTALQDEAAFLRCLPGLFLGGCRELSSRMIDSLLSGDEDLLDCWRRGSPDLLQILSLWSSPNMKLWSGVEESPWFTLIRLRTRQPLDHLLWLTATGARYSNLRNLLLRCLTLSDPKEAPEIMNELSKVALSTSTLLREVDHAVERTGIVHHIRQLLSFMILSSSSFANAFAMALAEECRTLQFAEPTSTAEGGSMDTPSSASSLPPPSSLLLFAAQLYASPAHVFLPSALKTDLIAKVATIVREVYNRLEDVCVGTTRVLPKALEDTIPPSDVVKLVRSQFHAALKAVAKLRIKHVYLKIGQSPPAQTTQLAARRSVAKIKGGGLAGPTPGGAKNLHNASRNRDHNSPPRDKRAAVRKLSPLGIPAKDAASDHAAAGKFTGTSEHHKESEKAYLRRMEKALQNREPAKLRKRMENELAQHERHEALVLEHKREIALRCSAIRRMATMATSWKAKQQSGASSSDTHHEPESIDEAIALVMTPRTKQILEEAKRDLKAYKARLASGGVGGRSASRSPKKGAKGSRTHSESPTQSTRSDGRTKHGATSTSPTQTAPPKTKRMLPALKHVAAVRAEATNATAERHVVEAPPPRAAPAVTSNERPPERTIAPSPKAAPKGRDASRSTAVQGPSTVPTTAPTVANKPTPKKGSTSSATAAVVLKKTPMVVASNAASSSNAGGEPRQNSSDQPASSSSTSSISAASTPREPQESEVPKTAEAPTAAAVKRAETASRSSSPAYSENSFEDEEKEVVDSAPSHSTSPREDVKEHTPATEAVQAETDPVNTDSELVQPRGTSSPTRASSSRSSRSNAPHATEGPSDEKPESVVLGTEPETERPEANDAAVASGQEAAVSVAAAGSPDATASASEAEKAPQTDGPGAAAVATDPRPEADTAEEKPEVAPATAGQVPATGTPEDSPTPAEAAEPEPAETATGPARSEAHEPPVTETAVDNSGAATTEETLPEVNGVAEAETQQPATLDKPVTGTSNSNPPTADEEENGKNTNNNERSSISRSSSSVTVVSDDEVDDPDGGDGNVPVESAVGCSDKQQEGLPVQKEPVMDVRTTSMVPPMDDSSTIDEESDDADDSRDDEPENGNTGAVGVAEAKENDYGSDEFDEDDE